VRTRKTVGGHTTQYALDLATTLPVVISDTEAVYLYGLHILAQQQTERLYYFHDGLGSVRQLLDTTGQIETNYAYDPFGVPVMGGDGSNLYQFTGEAWDAEVELLYLRARYYQPEVGRFITKDPWAGGVWRPSRLNRYVYVTNNPVNYMDPGGLNGSGGPGGLCPECKELMHPYEPSGVIGPGRGPLVGDTELPYTYSVPPPSGVAGPGKGPLVPDRNQLPYTMTPGADVRVPPTGETVLLMMSTWDPDALNADLLNYQEHGYGKRGSLALGQFLVTTWFFPVPKVDYWFGPEWSFTQDVRHDTAIDWFWEQWARQDPPFKVPFGLSHERDSRDGSWESQQIGWMLFRQENYELNQCLLGHGSDRAEGPIDPVGGILGSFDRIEVSWSRPGMVRFEVHNRMDRASASRWPGSSWYLFERVDRNLWNMAVKRCWWGTTVYQHFYWEEPHPLGLRRY
jgi:RHS repeat-associated protein